MPDPIVTDESEKTAAEVVVDTRSAAMNAIAERIARESGSENEGEELAGEQELSEQDVAGEPEKVVVKVNGEEVAVDREKIIEAGVRTYQKETAADKRLREAAEIEARLREREEKLAQMERALLEKESQEPDEESKKLVDAIFNDEEQAAKEFSKLKKTVKQLTAAQQKIEAKEQEKIQNEYASATKHYHDNYRDIAGDDDLHLAFNRRLKTIHEEKPGLTARELVDESARQVYERFGIEKKPEPSRKEIKENLVKQPRAASARRAPPPEDKQPTRSDVLKGMRTGRAVQSY